LLGILAGVFLIVAGGLQGNVIIGAIQILNGIVLVFHTSKNLIYYKKHRIIKIEKVGDKRIITKE
jgi:hypothetical protein